jgi:hypothetical protein
MQRRRNPCLWYRRDLVGRRTRRFAELDQAADELVQQSIEPRQLSRADGLAGSDHHV